MLWYEELDFEDNPFELDLLKSDFKLIGLNDEAEEIIYRIHSGSMIMVEGKDGTGKTTLLQHVIENFQGKGKVIYLDGEKLNKRLNISKLLKKRRKGWILLMDNVQSLSKRNNDKIKYYYDEDYIKSVVFTVKDTNVDFTNSILDRIGDNVIKLNTPKLNDVIEMVKDRLEDHSGILPENVLKQLYNDSDNLKDFMKLCDLTCNYIVINKKDKATVDDLKKIHKVLIEEEEDKTIFCSDCKEPLIEVKKEWRCSNCDRFCSKCGGFFEEDDENCPVCNSELKVEAE